jgi:hypothetical protein
MSDNVSRHGEIHRTVISPGTESGTENRGGYPAPNTPFEMPTMTPSTTPPGGSDTPSGGSGSSTTTSASDD